MPIPSRLIAAALFAMPPALALAWMPEPPPGYGPPGYGYPGFPPPYAYPDMGPPPSQPWAGPEGAKPESAGSGLRGAPAPERGAQSPPAVPEAAEQGQPSAGAAGTSAPPQAAPPAEPAAPEGYGAPYGAPYGRPFGSVGERPRVMPGQLRVTREMTEDAYLVRILVGDGKTDEVQITPLGRSLAISRSADTQTEQEERFDDGRGYQRSFSYSRGAASRRLGLPPDADLSGMTREVADGTITLRIPRTARRGWGQGYGPGQPPMPGAMPQGMGPAQMAPPTPEAPPAPAGQP